MYWNVVLLGIAVTGKVPSYPDTLTPAIVTLPLTANPTGFAVDIVIVTVLPLSLADAIAAVVMPPADCGPGVQV